MIFKAEINRFKYLPEPQTDTNNGEHDVTKLKHGQETGTNTEANLSADFGCET